MRRVDVVLQEVGQRQVSEGCDGRLHVIALSVDSDVIVLVEVHSGAHRAEQLSLALRIACFDLAMLRLVMLRLMSMMGVGRSIVERLRVGVGVRRHKRSSVTVEREGLLTEVRVLVSRGGWGEVLVVVRRGVAAQLARLERWVGRVEERGVVLGRAGGRRREGGRREGGGEGRGIGRQRRRGRAGRREVRGCCRGWRGRAWGGNRLTVVLTARCTALVPLFVTVLAASYRLLVLLVSRALLCLLSLVLSPCLVVCAGPRWWHVLVLVLRSLHVDLLLGVLHVGLHSERVHLLLYEGGVDVRLVLVAAAVQSGRGRRWEGGQLHGGD